MSNYQLLAMFCLVVANIGLLLATVKLLGRVRQLEEMAETFEKEEAE
jgi:hypothetical protein